MNKQWENGLGERISMKLGKEDKMRSDTDEGFTLGEILSALSELGADVTAIPLEKRPKDCVAQDTTFTFYVMNGDPITIDPIKIKYDVNLSELDRVKNGLDRMTRMTCQHNWVGCSVNGEETMVNMSTVVRITLKLGNPWTPPETNPTEFVE